MVAKNQDFEVYSGDNKTVIITVADLDSISGCTVDWAVYRHVGGEILLVKTTEDSVAPITVLNPNLIYIPLVPTDTSQLKGTYNHEVELTSSSGTISTVTVGKVTIIESIA